MPVDPAVLTAEDTATTSADNDNNNTAEPSNFINNDEIINAEAPILPVPSPLVGDKTIDPTHTTIDHMPAENETSLVPQTRSKREVRRPAYLTDYECDRVATQAEINTAARPVSYTHLTLPTKA